VYTIEPYVLSGYRPQSSYMGCLYSMFRWHNQTVNIWTSVFLMIYNIWMVLVFTRQAKVSGWALFFFWIHGLGRSYCWLNSWGFHTFSCHSEKTAITWCKMDYIGCYLTPLTMGVNLMFVEFYDRR
jgi:adiponectin receptor